MEPRREFLQFPDRPSALSRRRQLQTSRRCRSRSAGRRPRALVSAAARGRPRARSSSINENQFKGHMIYQQLHADALSRRRHRSVAASADRGRARRQARRRRDQEAPREMDARARRVCRRPQGRKGQGASGNGKAIDPLDADRDARRSHAGRHDLRRRDHHARAGAAPASAVHHAAQLLPRLRRARPGHRHRARHQARRAASGRWRS